MDDVIRVEEKDLNVLITNLQTYYDNISQCLNDMEETMAKMPSCFEGEIPDSISNKFKEFEDKFPIVKGNIESFVQDFKNLDTAFKNEQNAVYVSDVEEDKGGDFINVSG